MEKRLSKCVLSFSWTLLLKESHELLFGCGGGGGGGGWRQHFMSRPKETQEHLRNKVTGISMERVTKLLLWHWDSR